MSDKTDSLKTKATLGGFPLLASSSVRWRLIEGCRPCIETFDMIPSDAKRLLATKGPVKLEMTSNESTVTVEGVYPIFAMPGPNPFIARVTVADRRYWWKYDHIGPKRYNMRRKVGARYVKVWGPPQMGESAPKFEFAPYSTKNNKGDVSDRWGADDLVRDILRDLDSAERRSFSTGFGEPLNAGDPFGNVQMIEDLEIDDAGDAAMQRALKASPGLGLYVNLAGKVVLFSKVSGIEAAALGNLGPQLTTGGVTKLVSNSRVRPREIHVLFTREIEVRFDYSESTLTHSEDDRYMDNVLPIPDAELTVGSAQLGRGTYIRIQDAYTAFGTLPLCNVTCNATLLEVAMVPHNSMSVMAGLAGVLNVTGANADWPPRIQALQTNWRQTFRINRRWMDRIFQLRAYSVGTIDQTSGQRAPARAYADHCYFASKKGQIKQYNETLPTGNASCEFCVNVSGYPTNGKIDGTEEAAPCRVSIADGDQGVLHTQYVTDLLRNYEMVLPSKMDETNIPCGNIKDHRRPISLDSMPHAGRRPKMSSEFKIAIIVTAIPAAPNNEQQLHRIVVKPNDCRALIPGSQNLGLDDAQGPILEIRVPGSVETARIIWTDEKAAETEKAFGIRGKNDVPDFGDNCINEKSGKDGAASLNAIALAEAASAYAAFADRNEGVASGMLNASVTPGGWLAEVVHEITPEGVGKTTVNLPSEIPALTLWAYLDRGTRAVLMRSVEKAA